jgi:hypothetical protein
MKTLILTICLALATGLSTFSQDDSSCNGRDVRCSDGHYHAPDGTIQPDTCATHEGDTHPCQCERATKCGSGGPNLATEPGSKCQTYCRKNACTCVVPSCS